MIAAPSSGCGLTTVCAAILHALCQSGRDAAGAKAGLDPRPTLLQSRATGRGAYNLDTWAMRPQTRAALLADAYGDSDLLLIEGSAGLFDGDAAGLGATADLAEELALPVVLLIDAQGLTHSIAPLLEGFARHRSTLPIVAVILNRVAGPTHEKVLRQALQSSGAPVLGAIPDTPELAISTASEAFLDGAAAVVARSLDLSALAALAQPVPLPAEPAEDPGLPAPGRHLAIARDEAFAPLYPHLLDAWRAQGVELSFFSPLADEAPAPTADVIWLPGSPAVSGLAPETFDRLVQAKAFRTGLQAAAADRRHIYGEGSGFMLLGESLLDSKGLEHPLLGLLPLRFALPTRRTLPGRQALTLSSPGLWGEFGTRLRACAWEDAVLRWQGLGEPLFQAFTPHGEALGPAGIARGSVAGSLLRLVDRNTL
ncbi:cobyrinate a,c-diamide synthase [Aquibaculum arenosum]|uniref:Cobyrinate a,c-diamide synthase n=1 Tax=Aquibaculum arenosum TaxID=3032591 RepID=A0ABT5YM99_9PROT|nr:cobyrinate a,c-diamide synthase [Fodinicurvata sp. CAU 1616]MDF2096088.1 cobyrinate a,c-diamide synthase [Fodinicurvata sp. CAU 1616]